MPGFMDTAKHDSCGYRFAIYRQGRSAGKVVQTYCPRCSKMFKVLAGGSKRDAAAASPTKSEQE